MRSISRWLSLMLWFAFGAHATDEATGPLAVSIDPQQVIAEATAFAGSRENAEALVEGLRLGGEVVLVEPDSTVVRFHSPAGQLGYGNVSIALALAGAALSMNGIAEPGVRQLAATLAGGELQAGERTVAMEGVLVLRAAGLKWGEVAEAMGFSLGDAVSVASVEDPQLRVALAVRHVNRPAEIIERSIGAQPAFHRTGARPDWRGIR
jgi:hypothetical protein